MGIPTDLDIIGNFCIFGKINHNKSSKRVCLILMWPNLNKYPFYYLNRENVYASSFTSPLDLECPIGTHSITFVIEVEGGRLEYLLSIVIIMCNLQTIVFKCCQLMNIRLHVNYCRPYIMSRAIFFFCDRCQSILAMKITTPTTTFIFQGAVESSEFSQ